MTALPDRPLVKICGLKTLEHAQAVSDAGADLIGFVFAPSRRQVTAEQTRAIVDALQGDVTPTGLFVDQPVEEINATADAAGIELLQVHWRPDERDLLALERPYLLVRRTEPGASYDKIAPELDRVLNSPNPPLKFLVDSYHPSVSGGTGIRADWEFSAQLASGFPIVLAGGLDPSNVAKAIETVHPAGVDVSTGVELDGTKSPELIRAFVERARAAFSCYSSSSEMTTQS